jgi:fructose transport system substrate-binding protein
VSKISGLFTSIAAAVLSLALVGGPVHAGEIVGLITKTNTNPFFVKMKEGFEAKAKEVGLTPQAYAGKFDGDNDGEVRAIEQLIAAGAKGILLVPSDSTAIVPTVKKARDAGILVITLDTPLDPVDAADALFATDNYKAGQLIGQWAKGTLGDKASSAKIATLDLTPNQPTVDYLRHNGFLDGYGITVKDKKHYATSDSPQIVGSDVTKGATEGGRQAMENGRQGEGRHFRRRRWRVPGREVGQGRHPRCDLPAISASNGGGRRAGGGGLHQDRQEADKHRHG